MKPDGATKTLVKFCTAAAIIAAAPFTAISQDAAKPEKQPAAPDQPVTEVKKEDFRVTVTLPAIFEGTRLTPVAVDPKAWADLTITSAVDHGTHVKKGTRLVQLNLQALEEQVAALGAAEQTARLTLQATVEGLAHLEKTTPLEIESARRSMRQADENLDRWIKIGRARDEEAAKRNVEAAERQLEYAREELDQLQKMYDADDLTEETEEIILKRAKIGVEQGEYYLERAIESRDYALKTGIPRQHQAALDSHTQAKLANDLAMRTIPRSLALKRLEVAKAKDDAAKATKKFGDMKRDLATLSNITAPTDGVVYHGQSVLGNWTTAADTKKLIPGGKLAAKVPFMTVVGDGGLRVQTTLPEDKLAILKPGARGFVTPVSNPLLKIPARLGKIDYAASPVGFTASATIDLPERTNLMPGMKGSLNFITADRFGVITVPVSAISSENNQHFVYLPKEGAEPEKRRVIIAETDGQKVVVLSGLAENDKVLTIAP